MYTWSSDVVISQSRVFSAFKLSSLPVNTTHTNLPTDQPSQLSTLVYLLLQYMYSALPLPPLTALYIIIIMFVY